MKFSVLLPPGAAAGLAAGFLAWRWAAPPDRPPIRTVAAPVPATALGERRPDFRLPDLAGRPRDVGEWDGKVLMINFWATWCAPCLEEIPMLVDLHRRFRDRGFEILGVALDQAEPVREFRDRFGMEYPILVGEGRAIDVGRRYGNSAGALPYTVVVDRAGRIVFQRFGIVERADAKSVIEGAL